MSIKKFSIPNTNSFPNPYKGIERVNQPITDEQAFIDMFNLITERDYPVSRKYYCVMLFVEESDITCNPQDNGNGLTPATCISITAEWHWTSMLIHHVQHHNSLTLKLYQNSSKQETKCF